MALVFFAVFLAVATALASYVVTYYKFGRHTIAAEQALALAEGGIDKAAYQLNQDSGYTGESNLAIGEGTVTIAVTSIDANTKRVTATAYVPNATTPEAKRSVTANLAINSSVVSFRFGVQVGNGGVIMGNGATINGNLYTNGSVVGAGGSNGIPIITGDVTVAGGTQPSPDQTWSTENSSVNVGDANARNAVAQSFIPATSGSLNKVSLYLKKTGSPGDITLKIVSDNSGKPSNTVLASGSLPASSVGTAYSFIDGTLTTAPTLTTGTTYWIVAIASVNSSNYFVWGSDSADGYANGTAKSSSNWSANNASWTSLAKDADFKSWMGGVVTSLSGVQIGGTAWAHAMSNCTIAGDAKYQTISGCTVSGTQTVVSTDASPAAMPISDAQITDWESTAANGGTIAGNYTITGSQSLGPKKIDGDLTVNGTLYLTGPVWVKGNVTFGNNSGLIVSASTGNNGAIIIADYPGGEATKGIVTLSNNMTISGNGSASSYPMILSTNTGSSAITMNNNSTSVILYAPDGTVTVSNNATANQITAKTLNLSNNTTVNYVNGLQNQSFSNGPGGSWTYVSGTYSITH
ncbi:MAG: choice-of-anchor R domain-containing protein [Bacillota bacterium]